MEQKHTRMVETQGQVPPDQSVDKAKASASIVRRLRKLREEAQDHNFGTLAYFLHMAEIEASDVAAEVHFDEEQDADDA